MSTRKIIQIDEDKCTGCGLCVPSCAEGAIQIIDGKARLVSDRYCDGLGACLGECPEDALHIIEREADNFDEVAAMAHVSGAGTEKSESLKDIPMMPSGCPGTRARVRQPSHPTSTTVPEAEEAPSQLATWPVQLHLLSPQAPYLEGADLLLAADCVPFAYADFHRKLLKGNPVAIGCPKLDAPQPYIDKLAIILQGCHLNSLTVAHMEVPCCMGLVGIARAAMQKAGATIPFHEVTISINGERR